MDVGVEVGDVVPTAEAAHDVSVVAQAVTWATVDASSAQFAAVSAQVTTPATLTVGRVTLRLLATQVAPVCPQAVTAAGVAAAAMQLLSVVSHWLTLLIVLATCGGRTLWACVTAHDSRLLAHVVRALTVVASLTQVTAFVTQLAVPVTTVGRFTWRTDATHWASVAAQDASWEAVVAAFVHDRSALVQSATLAMALVTWAGRPLLAVAVHCVYCAGHTMTPKRGLLARHVLRCVAHCASVSPWADVLVLSVLSGEPGASTPAAQPATKDVPRNMSARIEEWFIEMIPLPLVEHGGRRERRDRCVIAPQARRVPVHPCESALALFSRRFVAPRVDGGSLDAANRQSTRDLRSPSSRAALISPWASIARSEQGRSS
jgi:hypothetical protein